MDVQCERCKTEYEFDDALVSGRGTTVKCTNCGLQFKVRPSANATDAERWIVHTARGQELTFTSLRDLQRAITTHEVGRGDTLRRGNAPPRTLGTIAELEPFFLARPPRNSERPPSHEDGRSRVPTLRPPPAMAVPPSGPVPRLARVPTGEGGVDRNAPAYSEAGTMMAPAVQSTAAPSVVSRNPSAHPPAGEEISARPNPSRPPATAGPPGRSGRPTSHGPPALPVRRVAEPADMEEPSDPLDSVEDADSRYAPSPPRRRMGGWIVAAVLLTCVGVIGYKVAEPYLATASHAPARKPMNPRTEQFLTEGESAFHEGNLELAKEKFDKASALDETEPRVLLDVARLAAARADVPWLLTRIVPESSVDELRAAKQQLADLGAVAKRTAEAASSAAPDDVAATRVKVDALRIVGERDAARASVNKLTANASQPDTAYVLAALDLSEMDPLWATLIDRLRVAAAGEGNAGRARAALVYALARSGDVAGAKAELDRLRSLPTAYPLAGALAAFVARAPAGPVAKGSASSAPAGVAAGVAPGATPTVDVDSLPRRPVGGGGGGGERGERGGGANEESTGGGDARELMKQAATAENKGQFAKARKLYEDATHVDPANSEALAGLGSVALKTGDNASARSYYGHALSLNPNFVPALVGQADAMWAEGDHAGATTHYKDIVDRFPESSGYPSYVKTRAEGSASGTTPPPAAATPDTPPAAPAPPPAASPAADPAPAPRTPSAGGGSVTLPANVPSDLPGTPP